MSKKFTLSKIYQDKFCEIKKQLRTSISDKEIMRRHNVGKTTLQTIRRCHSYEDYVKYMTDRLERRRKKSSLKAKTPTDTSSSADEMGEPQNIAFHFAPNFCYRRSPGEICLQALYDVCAAIATIAIIVLLLEAAK